MLKLVEDAAGVGEEADLVEVYLLFGNNVLPLLQWWSQVRTQNKALQHIKKAGLGP